MTKRISEDKTEGTVKVYVDEIFEQAFVKLHQFNQAEDIEPEQFRKNIETMMKLSGGNFF
ncbi:hypothetical protein [Bacillus cereus]|uniref:hypothetical protein n=1 Tax=Bacillus cereus TaxID=1396 RepID=UPI000BF9CB16|nr:hypothetical protein [Bacillus cereus]PEQ65510.1 hypothetical protein CN469_11955 [Bacillus cereus]